MFKAIIAVTIFVAFQVRMACTSDRAKKYRLACELDRRLGKV